MTNNELKEALQIGCPVICNNIRYSRVYGIIYRMSEGHIKVSAELLDKNNNCLVIARVADVIREN